MPNETRRPKQPLSVLEVAEQIGCSDDHVRNLIAKGELPAIRVPGIGRRAARIVVQQEDLDHAVDSWKV